MSRRDKDARSPASTKPRPAPGAKPAKAKPAKKPAPPAPRAKARARRSGVVAAVRRDLERLGAPLAESALAATALALAGELDDTGTSATAKSMCARALTEVMTRLRELQPPEQEEDAVDELASRRQRRLARDG